MSRRRSCLDQGGVQLGRQGLDLRGIDQLSMPSTAVVRRSTRVSRGSLVRVWGQLLKGRGHCGDLRQGTVAHQPDLGVGLHVQGHGQLSGDEALGHELGAQPRSMSFRENDSGGSFLASSSVVLAPSCPRSPDLAALDSTTTEYRNAGSRCWRRC
jgi:hypothetical protein